MKNQLCGWGRVYADGREIRSEDLLHTPEVPLFRGLGRSYGDSSLPPLSNPVAVSTVMADRVLAFDGSTGVLKAEAGLSLSELNRISLPRGFFTPVTPGTAFVTLGGMVAADVHGKNHHLNGCFGSHVTSLKMKLASREVVTCSPQQQPDLFWGTVGGMGLTGYILEVEFKLNKIPSPWLWFESERVANIDEYLAKLKEAAATWPFTVGWIDCLSQGKNLGRGILTKGRWATTQEARSSVPEQHSGPRFPFEAPGFMLGPLSIKAFNFAYYWKHLPKKREGVVSPFPFFYPLDAIRDWNLMYGRRGFTQYQCVLPNEKDARPFLELLTSKGGASFLCVIKDCGAEGNGLLSFPKKGISIALDIPIQSHTQELVDVLNDFIIPRGGRIYLAKDTFTRADHFRAMEPRLNRFLEVRSQYDPEQRLGSAQSVRLLGGW